MKKPLVKRGRSWSTTDQKAIVNTVLSHGGRARWRDFKDDPYIGSWSRAKIYSYLERAVDSGVLSKRLEHGEKRPGYTYILGPKKQVEIFNQMHGKLNEEAKALYAATQQLGLNVTNQGKRLIDGVDELLRYQRALTLMAMKLAMSAPSEEKAAHRFLVLMDTFTPDAAGNALWLCWENKDIAADVLEAMQPKHRVVR